MSTADPQTQHEQAAQAILQKSLVAMAAALAKAGLRAEIQDVYRDDRGGPFSSEVSALLWAGNDVIDCLVFPVWSYGRPVPLPEVTRMINDELAHATANRHDKRSPR